MDGGFALRIPIDALQEFRILTPTASPEYGGNISSVTTIVTKSGTPRFHGSVYEFFRNDIFDTAITFAGSRAPEAEPVWPHRRRSGNRQKTIFLRLLRRAPQLFNLAAGGTPFLGGKLPPSAITKVGLNVAKLYFTGNTASSIYTSTLVGTNNYDQTGLRRDLHRTEPDSCFLRYSYFIGLNLNPISVGGSDLPGFPTRDDYAVHSAVIGNSHPLGAHVTDSVQTSFSAMPSSSISASTGMVRALLDSTTIRHHPSDKVHHSST